MKKLTLVGMAAVLVLMGAVGVNAAGSRIGVIDMTEIVKAFDETKTVESLLQETIAEYEAENEQMRTELEKLTMDFQKAREEAADKALSEVAREAKIKAAEAKRDKAREFGLKLRETIGLRQQQISEQRARMHRMIVGKLREVIDVYAEKEGFGLIVDSSAVSVSGIPIVLYGVDKIDVTKDVVKLIEAQNKKSKKD